MPTARTSKLVEVPMTMTPSTRAAPITGKRRFAERASWRSFASVQNWTMSRFATTSDQT